MGITNKEYADSLRLIADLFETHPEIEIPHYAATFDYFSAHTKADLARIVRAAGRPVKKLYDTAFPGSFEVLIPFGGITFRAIANRDAVCERVVVAKQVVAEVVIPAREAETIPAHEEDIVEWRCDSALLQEEPIPIDAPGAQAIRHDLQTARDADAANPV